MSDMLYCKSLVNPARRASSPINIGGVVLGGDSPVRVQSMTTTNTNDTTATVEQCIRIIEAGGELVRITAQGTKEAANLESIKRDIALKGYSAPLVADIHFNPAAALEAAKHIAKVRINPGNYADPRAKFQKVEFTNEEYQAELARIEERLLPLIELCKANSVAMRIGVNHGSLSDRIMSRFGDSPRGMAESAMEFLRICRRNGYNSVVVSMKASNTQVMVQATRLLVALMDAEGMSYPLHLGVTEAGDGEDGRIKSAVGIGALLADGIGDTIRVSLTEEPELEIPVAIELVNHFANRSTSPALDEPSTLPFDPYTYNRRISEGVLSIGASNPPVVMANLAHLAEVTQQSIEQCGWILTNGKWAQSDMGADFIHIGSAKIQGVAGAEQLPIVSQSDLGFGYRIIDVDELPAAKPATPVFVGLSYGQLTADVVVALKSNPYAVVVLKPTNANPVAELKASFIKLLGEKVLNPVVIALDFASQQLPQLQIASAADFGSLLIDGFGDGIMISAPKVDTASVVSTAFSILQATRTRISKTEYISCPGCGRTLFSLQETLARIRAKTSHIKGLKIGVMGCIVNGPGEMADADYGYVGAGPGKISLYKNKEVVRKSIPESEAVDALIALIKENGDWKD